MNFLLFSFQRFMNFESNIHLSSKMKHSAMVQTKLRFPKSEKTSDFDYAIIAQSNTGMILIYSSYEMTIDKKQKI